MKLRSALFVATIIAGSFLLFLVQPMIARMALPRLGGAPAVWNSAMLVYQMLLLGGYAYAHKLGGLKFKSQAMVHVALLVLAMLWLPVGLSAFQPPANAATAFWVPYLLVTSIGPLFFAVAAQAPLMQRWFGLAEGAGEPYALYAASNLGSFGGLIAYPLLVEPYLAIPTQRLLWSGLYLLLVLLVAGCALATWRIRRNEPLAAAHVVADKDIAPPDMKTRAHWVILAAVPSGLMLSTTTHLTTDIMAMPLLWALPLGLYLLSFSIAFATARGPTNAITWAAPIILLITGAIVIGNPAQTLGLATSLILLMTVAVALHGEMYRTRPDPKYLTLFYLLMSVGGALGGVFCALIAPLVFDWTWEHPILILAAAWLLPQVVYFRRNADGSAGPSHLAALAAIVMGGLGIYLLGDMFEPWVTVAFITGLLVAVGIFMSGKRLIFTLVMLAIMLLNGLTTSITYTREGARVRSYFGVYTVQTDETTGIRRLDHGTTTHGLQRLRDPKSPTSYYGPKSGIGLALAAAPRLFGDAAHVAIVGLGTGTLACYKQPGQDWKFYEIDPAVADIAKDTARFTFLSGCAPLAPIVIGDARLSLASATAKSIDLLAVDAFSSDAIPLHLLTKEAFDVYDRAVSDKGVIMVHISNRWVDLRPVLIAEAKARGWSAAYRIDDVSNAQLTSGLRASNWVVLARNPAQMLALTGPLARAGAFPADKVEWQALPAKAQRWTDDYASVLPLLNIWGRRTNDTQ